MIYNPITRSYETPSEYVFRYPLLNHGLWCLIRRGQGMPPCTGWSLMYPINEPGFVNPQSSGKLKPPAISPYL